MGTSTMKNKRSAVSERPVATSAHDEIAARAYHHYQERGELHGQDLDDWLLAEREWLAEHADVVISEIADE
jgi:Protein of unknown function (DUF2934)